MDQQEHLSGNEVDRAFEDQKFMRSVIKEVESVTGKKKKEVQELIQPPSGKAPITSKRQTFRGHLFKKGWGFTK